MRIKKIATPKENIKVNFYSGYKEEETPRSILIGGQEIRIAEILWRKRICAKKTGETMEVFCCRVQGKTVKIIRSESGECRLSPERISL